MAWIRIRSAVGHKDRIRRQVFTKASGNEVVALVRHEQQMATIDTYEEISGPESDVTFANTEVPVEDSVVTFEADKSPITGKAVKRKTVTTGHGSWTLVDSHIEKNS